MGKYLMALDAGTGSVRAVLFDLEGNQLGVSQQEWEHKEDLRFPGSMDFDWTHNWDLTCGCIRDVLKESGIAPSEIAAISTTCMREGIVLYDRDLHEIWACANVDARSDDEVVELIRKSPELEREIYKVSGQTYALGALPRILWVKNKMPEIYEKTAYVGMFNDWLILKLTGVMSIEPSNGSTTGIFDLSTRDWDRTIMEKCGLKSDIFPKVYESGTVVANVTKEAAEITGLAEGTPVVAGGGDAQLGCIGVGLVSSSQGAVFGGSFWQFEYNTSVPKTDDDCRVRVNCHALPNLWQYEALAFYPGLVMRWYRDAFCQKEKELAKETGRDTYDLMNEEAAKIPAGCYGMYCTFSDVMNYICWKHAAPTFTNFALDPDKFNRYTFYRAIMENSAMATKGNIELVASVTGELPKEIILPPALPRALWCQIVSDVLNIPVHVPQVKEATALGAAILAGKGVGIYTDIEETMKKVVKIEKTYYPNEENAKVYQDLYDKWRKVYAAQLALANEGLTKNMWSAPGV